MCEYCNENKPLFSFPCGCYVGIEEGRYNGKILRVKDDDLDADIKINFCPMCGRKLTND